MYWYNPWCCRRLLQLRLGHGWIPSNLKNINKRTCICGTCNNPLADRNYLLLLCAQWQRPLLPPTLTTKELPFDLKLGIGHKANYVVPENILRYSYSLSLSCHFSTVFFRSAVFDSYSYICILVHWWPTVTCDVLKTIISFFLILILTYIRLMTWVRSLISKKIDTFL